MRFRMFWLRKERNQDLEHNSLSIRLWVASQEARNQTQWAEWPGWSEAPGELSMDPNRSVGSCPQCCWLVSGHVPSNPFSSTHVWEIQGIVLIYPSSFPEFKLGWEESPGKKVERTEDISFFTVKASMVTVAWLLATIKLSNTFPR